MPLRISVFESKELQSAILTMRGTDREIAKNIRKVTKDEITPVWKQSVAEHVEGPKTNLEAHVLANTARVSVGDSNVKLIAGGLAKKLRGGGSIRQLTIGTEFGSDHYKQFGPRRKAGPVYHAAAADIPHIASVWARTVIRTFISLLPNKED